MKFDKLKSTGFAEVQLNAGVVMLDFDPDTAEVNDEDIIGFTSGGMSFSATPTYTNFGEDIDNCPDNMKDLKRLSSVKVTLSGTFVSMNAENAKMLMASADAESSNAAHLIPRNDLLQTDFTDIWLVADYSDKNGATKGGFMAVHIKNALNTGGFQWTTTDKGKGQFPFTFTGHYSMTAQDEVPYDIYVKAGEDEPEE